MSPVSTDSRAAVPGRVVCKEVPVDDEISFLPFRQVDMLGCTVLQAHRKDSYTNDDDVAMLADTWRSWCGQTCEVPIRWY